MSRMARPATPRILFKSRVARSAGATPPKSYRLEPVRLRVEGRGHPVTASFAEDGSMGERIDCPTIPFIEGDGTGPDIWRAARRVFDAAVAKASGGRRRVEWLEVLAGEKAFRQAGSWLPEATLETIRQYRVAIKGPLTTPVGGGIRSLNVALRQILDLYACV